MYPLVFDRASRAQLQAHYASRRSGEAMPLRWHEYLDRLSKEMTGHSAIERDWRAAVTRRATLISWQMSPETIATALGGGRLVYVSWGIPNSASWKTGVIAKVLRQAQHLLVNDAVTRAEIEALCGRDATLVASFYVDPDFFSFEPLAGRGDFVFCSGSNDRDPDMLLGLAELGQKVVWLVNDAGLRQRYEGRHANLVLKSKISYPELRDLYRTCAASIMPATRDAHCAGQTTGLESICCGAPLLISEGRTAGIFAGLPSVVATAATTSAAWVAALTDLKRDVDLQVKTTASRTHLANRVSRANFERTFKPIFGWQPAGVVTGPISHRTP